MRERTRKLTKKTECDGLRAHSSVGKRRRQFWAVWGGGWWTKDENDRRKKQKKKTKKTTYKRELRNGIKLDFLLEHEIGCLFNCFYKVKGELLISIIFFLFFSFFPIGSSKGVF
jgi:hypothetical protein